MIGWRGVLKETLARDWPIGFKSPAVESERERESGCVREVYPLGAKLGFFSTGTELNKPATCFPRPR